jgi:tetratricopeptide (TPR) repeat protein
VTEEDSVAFTPIQACLIALAYLEPRATLTRERITWLLWGLGEDAKTRHRIRQLLYNINSNGSKPVLERQGEAILPLLPSDANNYDPNDEPPLARITSPPTVDFEQWMDRAVESLGNQRRRRLAQRIDELSEEGLWSDAARAATALALIDPLQEEWVEVMVGLSVKARRPNSCLAALGELVATGYLDQDAFKGLARRLKAFPPSWLSDPSNVTLGPLIGRTREQMWVQAKLGACSGLDFVAIEGAGGTGKTRLIEEAGLAALAKGLRVVETNLNQTTAATPTAAVEMLITSLLTCAEPPQLPHPWATILGLRRDQVERLEPLSNNRRFAEAIRIALAAAAADDLLLLVLENFQFADSSSLELLAKVSSTWRESRCVILLSIRSEPIEDIDSKLNVFLTDVRADRIHLKGLSDADSRELVNRHAPKGLSDAARQEIVEIGRGNPQMLIDLSKSWDRRGEWERLVPPRSLQALVAGKVGRLSPAALEVLSIVSAAPGIGSDQLGQILARPSWSVVEILDRLVACELIEMVAGCYVFRHSLFQEAATIEMGSTRIREAHLRIARQLASTCSSAPSEIVHHFRRAGAPAEAFRWAVEAARQAREVGALAQALDFYEVALESGPGRDKPELLAEAGQTCLMQCRRTEGIVLLKRAEDLGSPALVPPWAIARLDAQSESGQVSHAEASSRLSSVAAQCASTGDWESSLAAVETAIRVLERAGDWRGIQTLLRTARASSGKGGSIAEIRRHMILALGMVYGEEDTASRSARRAFRMASRSGVSDDLRARVAHRLFVVLLSEGTVETPLGWRCLDVLKARVNATGDLKLHYTTLANQAVWYLDTDAPDEAEGLLVEAGLVVSGSRATNERQNLATNLGDLLLRQQRPDEALRSFELARSLIEPGTRGFLTDLAIAGLGLSKLRLGQFQAAERLSAEIGDYDHYYFDASLMIRLRVELMRHRRRAAEALDLLSRQRLMLRHSFVPQYLSLTLWEGQLRRRAGDKASRALFAESLERAEELGISRLAIRARAVAGAS